jgi:hypothetical protein
MLMLLMIQGRPENPVPGEIIKTPVRRRRRKRYNHLHCCSRLPPDVYGATDIFYKSLFLLIKMNNPDFRIHHDR